MRGVVRARPPEVGLQHESESRAMSNIETSGDNPRRRIPDELKVLEVTPVVPVIAFAKHLCYIGLAPTLAFALVLYCQGTSRG